MPLKRTSLRSRVSFTASIEEQPLSVAPGTYIHSFSLGYKGDIAAGVTVNIEDFLDLVNPFQVIINGDPKISLRGRDIYALDALLLKHLPDALEGAAGEDCKVMGLTVPFQHAVKAAEAISWLATRVAVTNISGEIISIGYTWDTKPLQNKMFHAVEHAGTSPSSTGWGTIQASLPRVGDLIAILLYSATVPTTTADTVTLQEVKLKRNEVEEFKAEWFELQADSKSMWTNIDASSLKDIMANYAIINLTEDPWDAKKDKISLEANFGVASSAYRWIPIYLV